MNQLKRAGTLSLARELSKNEQKKILGGGGCDIPGYKCDGTVMSCTISQITVSYCQQVWHSNIVDNCTIPRDC
jgi:hypothetical protein